MKKLNFFVLVAIITACNTDNKTTMEILTIPTCWQLTKHEYAVKDSSFYYEAFIPVHSADDCLSFHLDGRMIINYGPLSDFNSHLPNSFSISNWSLSEDEKRIFIDDSQVALTIEYINEKKFVLTQNGITKDRYTWEVR